MTSDQELVMKRIEEVFGLEKGQAWLNKPNYSLGGKTPAEMIASPEGLEEVLKVLSAIEWGGAL